MDEMRTKMARETVAMCYDKATRTSYRTFRKAYDMAVRAAKKDFCVASIASASSCLAQLFRTIYSLT